MFFLYSVCEVHIGKKLVQFFFPDLWTVRSSDCIRVASGTIGYIVFLNKLIRCFALVVSFA